MAPPTGLSIRRDSRSPTWRVGKKIGEGVCGTVHELRSAESNEKWAIKMAPLPGAAKGARKKLLERNANVLNMEKLMYTAHLNGLRGSIIPKMPSSKGPPEAGEVDGFRFIVMEFMEAPLWGVIPALLAGAKRGKVPFGAVASRMLDCLEAMHKHSLLFVDVKPENFMLSHDGTSLASKIRLIDLGLLQDMRRVGGRRPNESGKDMAGTPLYASLNVHEGNTIGPRDDLEALGYVLGELILVLQAELRGQSHKENESLLPWSNGTSDEDIHKLKKDEVTSTGSSFFSGLGVGGNDHVERAMREYLAIVRNLRYKAKPDYTLLRNMLTQLDLVAPKKKKAKSTKSTTPIKKASKGMTGTTERIRRSARSATGVKRPSPRGDDEEYEFDPDSPPKSRGRYRLVDTHDEEDGGVEPMEWETEQDENEAPLGWKIGATLLFTSGPHKGEAFALTKGETETIVLGHSLLPVDGSTFQLNDINADASHTKLVLKANKKLQTVEVVDLNSNSGTFVNRDRVPSGGRRQVFNKGTIQIGESKLEVRVFKTKGKQTSPKKVTVKAPPVESPLKEDVMMVDTENSLGRGPRIMVEFVEGPHKKESIVFQKGDLEALTFGSDPAAKTGETHTLRGKSIDASHARFELNVNRKVAKIVVYDLKSKSGVLVNNQPITKGKDRTTFHGDRIRIGDSVMVVKSA